MEKTSQVPVIFLLAIVSLLPIVHADLIAGPEVFAHADLITGPEVFVITGIFLVVSLLILLGVNFLLNRGISYVILLFFKGHMKTDKHPSNKTILFMTIAGLLIDIIVIGVGTLFLANSGSLTDFPLILAEGLGVFILVSIAANYLVFKDILVGKDKLIASILFGILSNPFWILLFTSLR